MVLLLSSSTVKIIVVIVGCGIVPIHGVDESGATQDAVSSSCRRTNVLRRLSAAENHTVRDGNRCPSYSYFYPRPRGKAAQPPFVAVVVCISAAGGR